MGMESMLALSVSPSLSVSQLGFPLCGLHSQAPVPAWWQRWSATVLGARLLPYPYQLIVRHPTN